MPISVGRPALSKEETDVIFRKLEPYLKMGLSINKVCNKANSPKSTVYDLYNENSEFAEKIESARSYFTNLINNIIHKELLHITKWQESSLPLSLDDRKFLLWIAANSNAMKEYYCSNIQKLDD